MTKPVTLECAESLLESLDKAKSSDAISVIYSAMMMIVQCARFVEDHARNDPSLGILSLAILAKTTTGNVSDSKLFTLWGPRVSSGPLEQENHHAAAMSSKSNRSSTEENRDRSEHSNRPDPTENPPDPVENRDGSPRESNIASTKLLPVSIGPPNTFCDRKQPFKIDDRVAAKCLALLMDACGITSHPRICKYESLACIPASALIYVVRSVMDAYKEKHEVASKFVKYSSLLPQELRDRRANYSSLSLTRNNLGFSVVDSVQAVTLTVKKPDRNRKELHFALLASLLQVDPHGVCNAQLQKLALEGLGHCGCEVKPDKECSGPRACSERIVKPTCEFYDDKSCIIGAGEVYPSVSFFKGRPIGEKKILMRFSSLQSGGTDAIPQGFHLWQVDKVSRAKLLDAFGNELGSAIIAMNAVEQEGWNSLQSGNLEFSDAILVCDTKINDKHKADPYVFSEWSRFAQNTDSEHGSIPRPAEKFSKTLDEFGKQVTGFWHKRFLKKQELCSN